MAKAKKSAKAGKMPAKKKPVKKSARKPAVVARPKKSIKKIVTKSAHKTLKAKSKPSRASKPVAKSRPTLKKASKPAAALRKVARTIGKKLKKAVTKVTAVAKPSSKLKKHLSNGKTTKSSVALGLKKAPVVNLKASSTAKGKIVGKKAIQAPVVTAKKVESVQKPASNAVAATAAPISKEKITRPVMDEKLKKMAANALKRIPPEKRTGVLAINANATAKSKNEISPSKIAHISYSITNPSRKTDSYAIRPEKEPAGKFEMEFVVHASAEMLYEFISTPSGLSEWFCDDLNIRNGIYTFIWDDQLQQARLLKTIDQQLVRFQWVDKTDGSYFEFRIQRDDLTNDISLIITDFGDTHSERESSKLLWQSQVEKLMHVLGSIF
jgi:uncharacterized protein YndB with AHSA1/START domain